MRPIAKLAIAAAVMALATSAYALNPANGSTVTPLFTETDLVNDVVYPAGTYTIKWGDLLGSRRLGTDTWNLEVPVVGTDAAGVVFVRVAGGNLDGNDYTGVVRWDGSGFTNLLQDVMLYGNDDARQVGSQVGGVVVSPVTAGRLTAGHPVIARYVRPPDRSYRVDLVSVDPTTDPPAQTLVHSLTDGGTSRGTHQVFTIDANGAIYVWLPGSTEIRKLAWNGSSYAESTLVTGIGQWGVAAGADGAIYAFRSTAAWGLVRSRAVNDLLRIDAATGATSVHATVPVKYAFGGMGWDDTGRFWIGLGDANGQGWITRVLPGASVSTSNAATNSASYPLLRGWTDGPSGELRVLEDASFDMAAPTLLFRVQPGTGGGGGKGKGK